MLALQTRCFSHLKPFVVPPHVPVRYSTRLLLHVAKVQVAQVPLLSADDPLRYCPTLRNKGQLVPEHGAVQPGCALHIKPSDSPLQLPVRYWSGAHEMKEHVVHTPRLAVDAPFRNSLVVQDGCLAHVPFEVADCPVRYCPLGHSACAPHVKPLVVPLHLPDRYWFAPHLMFLHVAQPPFLVVDEPDRY